MKRSDRSVDGLVELFREISTGGERELLGPVFVADTLAARTRGLIGLDATAPAMLFPHAYAVHGAFLTMTLDVAFLDRNGVVVSTTVLRPWRIVGPRQRCPTVLEAPLDTFASWRLSVGDRLLVPGADIDVFA